MTVLSRVAHTQWAHIERSIRGRLRAIPIGFTSLKDIFNVKLLTLCRRTDIGDCLGALCRKRSERGEAQTTTRARERQSHVPGYTHSDPCSDFLYSVLCSEVATCRTVQCTVQSAQSQEYTENKSQEKACTHTFSRYSNISAHRSTVIRQIRAQSAQQHEHERQRSLRQPILLPLAAQRCRSQDVSTACQALQPTTSARALPASRRHKMPTIQYRYRMTGIEPNYMAPAMPHRGPRLTVHEITSRASCYVPRAGMQRNPDLRCVVSVTPVSAQPTLPASAQPAVPPAVSPV